MHVWLSSEAAILSYPPVQFTDDSLLYKKNNNKGLLTSQTKETACFYCLKDNSM